MTFWKSNALLDLSSTKIFMIFKIVFFYSSEALGQVRALVKANSCLDSVDCKLAESLTFSRNPSPDRLPSAKTAGPDFASCKCLGTQFFCRLWLPAQSDQCAHNMRPKCNLYLPLLNAYSRRNRLIVHWLNQHGYQTLLH